MMRLLLILLLAALPVPAMAQKMVADLSQSRVAITASFSGSDILVFGAVRDAGDAPFDIIVTVSGPPQAETVRKKDRVAGIWVNTESVDITAAPTFYSVASTRPLPEILSQTDDLRHSISIDQAIRSVGASEEVAETERFTDALVRIRTEDGTYATDTSGVTLIDQTLFRADIDLPSNIVEGDYQARIFMTRDKAVVASFASVLDVRKVGIERWIYTLAQEQALLYGLLSLAVAIAAGWGASATFRYIRGN